MAITDSQKKRLNRAMPINNVVKLGDFVQDSQDGRTLRDLAMSGDLVLVVTPATLGSSAAAITMAIGEDGFTRDVTVELQTAAGDVHTWFNGTFAAAGSEATAGDGTADVADAGTTVTLVNGVGTVTLEYIGAWAADDTATLTITGGTKLGYTVSNKTSVDTLIA